MRRAAGASRPGRRKMKYYISGPITGNADYKRQFDEAEETLRAAGFNDLVNPARLEDVGRLDPESDYEAIMAIDMILLSRSGGLVQLVGWEGSRGANREYGYAIARGMEIIDIREVTPVKGGVRGEKPEQASKEAMDAQKKAGRKQERVNHEVVHELRKEGYSWRAICEKLGKRTITRQPCESITWNYIRKTQKSPLQRPLTPARSERSEEQGGLSRRSRMRWG